MEFKIEKGVPVSPMGRPSKYPFREMEVGDSFFVPSEGDSRGLAANLSGAARGWGKRNGGRRFSIRREGNGVRVWRVE